MHTCTAFSASKLKIQLSFGPAGSTLYPNKISNAVRFRFPILKYWRLNALALYRKSKFISRQWFGSLANNLRWRSIPYRFTLSLLLFTILAYFTLLHIWTISEVYAILKHCRQLDYLNTFPVYTPFLSLCWIILYHITLLRCTLCKDIADANLISNLCRSIP